MPADSAADRIPYRTSLCRTVARTLHNMSALPPLLVAMTPSFSSCRILVMICCLGGREHRGCERARAPPCLRSAFPRRAATCTCVKWDLISSLVPFNAMVRILRSTRPISTLMLSCSRFTTSSKTNIKPLTEAAAGLVFRLDRRQDQLGFFPVHVVEDRGERAGSVRSQKLARCF